MGTTALENESLELSKQLYAFLRLVDPASWRDELETEANTQLRELSVRLRSLLSRSETEGPPGNRVAEAVRDRLPPLLATLDTAPTEKTREQNARAWWAALQKRVHPAYESFAAALRRADIPAPSLRPTNYIRNVFHVLWGTVAFVLIAFLPSRGWLIAAALCFATLGWTMELSRRMSPAANDRLMKLFGPVAHAHERYKINSATWYVSALVLLSLFASLPACATAVAVLALADPSAALVGRRIGRIKLYAGRSLEGTLTFFVVGLAAAFTVLTVQHHTPVGRAFLLAAAGSVAGATAELFSKNIDDNMSIPVSVGGTVTALAWLLG